MIYFGDKNKKERKKKQKGEKEGNTNK